MKANRIITFFVCFGMLCNFFGASSQNDNKVERARIGGISFDEKQQLLLEKANIGVYYQFHYFIKNESVLEKRTDTLLLASGATQSVFLDPTYKEELENNRKTRIARSRKAKLIYFEHENFNNISELININSDYKEDDAGDPVQIYKNRNTGIVSSVYNSYTENIRCDQKIEQMAYWQIVEEIDTILGYACQKANLSYAGRNYTAWFTPEIPISDGPWKFWGLPGLILKVIDEQGLFEWIGIGIHNLNADIVMDKANYDKATAIQFRDFIDRTTSTVIVSFYNDNVLYLTDKEKTYKKIPIELFEENR